MDQIGVRMGGRPGALGCLILSIPLLVVVGAAVVIGWIAGLLADVLLPSEAPPAIRLIVGFGSLWLLMRISRRRRSRRRPPRSGGSAVIDV